jgi:hypothetical protein
MALLAPAVCLYFILPEPPRDPDHYVCGMATLGMLFAKVFFAIILPSAALGIQRIVNELFYQTDLNAKSNAERDIVLDADL